MDSSCAALDFVFHKQQQYISHGRISQARQMTLMTERIPFKSAREKCQFSTIRKSLRWHTCHRVCIPPGGTLVFGFRKICLNAVKQLARVM